MNKNANYTFRKRSFIFSLLVISILILLTACQSEAISTAPTTTSEKNKTQPIEPLTISSTSFEHKGEIPSRYGMPPFTADGYQGDFHCEGAQEDKENRSPALAWENLPPETVSVAIVMAEKLSYARPDVPEHVLVTNWIVYNIPLDLNAIPEALPGELKLPEGALQGNNNFPEPYHIGYGGPCPPADGNEHLYIITLYALDSTITLPSMIMARSFEIVAENHILAKAELHGYYINQ